MYKRLQIGTKEYKLEYTIEASLYNECVERMMEFFGKTLAITNEQELTKGLSKEEKIEMRMQLVKDSLSGMINLPKTALTVFYAGLLEYHGEAGDNTVRSIGDAKALVKQYFSEHVEDGKDNFYDLLQVCMEQMGEDGFFKLTGMERFLSQNGESEEIQKPNRAKRRAKASGK